MERIFAKMFKNWFMKTTIKENEISSLPAIQKAQKLLLKALSCFSI